ncbi:MAG: hypothetical protein MI975_15975 [Cytophagales bacterium]|nr:hypothetical protein [Cytophagales bacterium]
MVDFIIKSTISLGILYLFYVLFLSHIKTLKFNRYFLSGSLIFALAVPLISIPVEFGATTFSSTSEVINKISSSIVQMDQTIYVPQNSSAIGFFMLPYLYGLVSFILLGRFTINLFHIIGTIGRNYRIRKSGHWLILDRNCTMPYTFFNQVIVNKDAYEKGIIDKRIMQHEVAHAKQLHSVDIVIVELLKVFMWVNPFVWLMKKPIQLNHEYLADSSVLTKNSISEYQNILINLVLDNNAGTLTSNFNFSLTKQRLKMMTRQFSKKQAVVNFLATGILVFFLGTMLAFNQKKDIEYTIDLDGKRGNYAKQELKHSDFAMMKITTNNKEKVVLEFDIILARGKRAIHYNRSVQGNQFDLKYFSEDTRDGDRIVIEILKISDENIELTQYNSIITIPIDFDK